MQKILTLHYSGPSMEGNDREVNKLLEKGWEIRKIVSSEEGYFCFLFEKNRKTKLV